MKVLFIVSCTGMAGANRSMYQLILELRNIYGVEAYVLLPYEKCDVRTLKNFLIESNIPCKECHILSFKAPSSSLEYRLDYVYYLREIESIAKELRPQGFDLVHSNSSVIDVGGYISRILGVKHVWHLRDFGELDYGLYSIWGNLYSKATYRNGDAFIAISNAIKKYFEKDIPANRIHTIYNGIKIDENVPLAKHENDVVQFICAGVINEAKNQKEIVKAIDILVNERKITSLHLTIVGAGSGEYVNNLKSYAEKRNISDYISYPGIVDGIAQIASTMDVGIMSSHCEAFGRATVEYMFQNLAVIVNDSGANPEIITDGQTGLIYMHDSAKSLADKMQMLIENKNLLKELGNNGRKEAIKRFQSDDNTRSIYTLYNNVLKKTTRFNSFSMMLLKLIMNVQHYRDVIIYKLYR